MILSTYVSDDGKARADVHLVGKRLSVVCTLKGEEKVKVGISGADALEAAENFAEDFVSDKNNNKKNEYGYYSGEFAVLR